MIASFFYQTSCTVNIFITIVSVSRWETNIETFNFSGFRAKRKTYLAPAIVKFPAELQTTQATKVSQGITEGQENANVGRQTTNQTTSVTIKNLSTSLLETKNLGNVTTVEPSDEILMMSPTTTNLSIKTDLELLDMFEEGIPCRSQLFSEHTRGLKEVSDRSSEVMMAYCKVIDILLESLRLIAQ